MTAPAAVLWDLDGTLVDSTLDLAAAGNACRAALGLPPLDVATVASYVGNGLGKLLERLCPDADPVGLAVARDEFVAHYAKHCADQTPVFPGVSELLAVIAAAGIPQAVVTNKPLSFTTTILDHHQLSAHFAAVIGGDGPKKPAPDQLLEACQRCGVDPAAVWMVGDHHTDLQAGRAAGCRVAWVGWGIGKRDDGPIDVCVDTPEQLLAALAIPR
ncbi:MAG: HAD-IA family hydrolase [Planctomycetota bacterium]|jgi:phosphoglycolate phosphatase|nr:HAD-IA family hydrolase [Planctomycetota bacterium]